MNQEITFGQVVKERRELLGLTQAELGRRVGCAAITIRRIEADSLRPSVQIAENLAAALGIAEVDYLAFVRLARANRDPSPLPTPPPVLEEIGLEDLSGRAIRGYQLGERIGSGGYGVVYRAAQATIKREVAVKIILPKFADRPEFIRRFEAEAQLVARLEHPHIVPLYDYWREPGVAYLVMRLLRGGSLATQLKNGPLAPEMMLPLLEQICNGLHAAHQAGVIHRDIKPANILLDETHNAYLADFGIAKITADGNVNETLEGMVLGSPAYISPEQILVEPVKPQSDIYSLGVMLYELLTGHKPFDGPTPFALIQQHLNEPFPSLALHRLSPECVARFDPIIQRATAKEQTARYADVLALLADFRRAAGEQRGRGAAELFSPLHPRTPAPLLELTNPYKGLRAFTEADAADFFGRETLVQELLARLADSIDLARFLAVVGPSGSGKSSVVRAGLIPALRQGGLPDSDKWFIIEMLPGSHPWEELEAALLRIAVNPPESLLAQLREDERGLLRAVRRILPADESVELVLIIDQFEELFTLVSDEDVRQHFLNSLVTAVLDPRSRLRVIITLRADFTGHPLQYVDFGELLRQRTEFVLPLTPDELEQAITHPARRVGLALEPGLAAAISRDVGQEPGALPLLQYALTELFERSTLNVERFAEAPLLTRAAYQASGGVLGALARRADEIYAGLDAAGQEATRQLFLRLITLGEGTEDTRRRVLRAEVETLNGAGEQRSRGAEEKGEIQNLKSKIQNVIDLFGKHRLLSFDRDPITRGPTVEVAHEALLREWGRLREWLDASRNDIRMQRLLAAAAAEWREANGDASFLLRGTRLDQFAGWAEGTALALTPDERTFLVASLTDRELRRAEEEARQRRELETAQKLAETERHAAQRLRQRALWLTGALAIAGVLAITAFLFAQQATQNERQAVLEADNRATAQAEAETQQANAEANQAKAESNLALSESQRLAAEANTIIQSGGNIELVALLSLRAMHTAYTPQADMALQQASKGDYGRRLFAGHTNDVNSLNFSPDGRLALSGSLDQTAKLWDVQTGQLLRTLTGHTGMVWDAAFSPDGRVALTGSEDHTARLWDVQTGRLLQTWTGYTDAVTGVAFSSDGQVAFTGCWEGTVRLWDVKTGREIHVLNDEVGIFGIALSPDGQFVLTANSLTGAVRLWEIKTGQEVRGLTGATAGVNSVAFTPDGHYALGGDWDGGLRAWDLRQTNAEPRLFAGHTNQVREVKVSPDGHYVLSASLDGTARLWDLQTGAEVRRFASVNEIHSIAFSPDGQTILIGDRYGAIRLWDIQPPPDPRTFSGHTDAVVAAKFSPDGRILLTGSTDQTARLWDAATGRELRVLTGHTDWVLAVAISSDGRYALTSGIADQTVRLWDLETGQEVHIFKHPAPVFGVAFSPDDRYILTAGNDKVARLWNIKTGQEVRTFEQPPNIFSVAFLPDGRYLLTGSGYDSSTRLWDAETGQEVRKFPGYAGFVNALSVSPDGKYILTGALEDTAQLWEVETGRALNRFSGENGVFSPDGKYILTGGLKTAHLWDRATGRQLRAFGVTNNLWGVAFSPDSKSILTFGEDKIARLWDLDYQGLVDSVCARVLRDFTDKEREQYGVDDQPTCP